MTHTRLRKFNTREAYPDQKLDNDVCMVVRAGNTVYVRGQTAMDLDGKIVGIGDAAAQAENAMTCAKILLEEAGSKLQDVVKITIYITDRAYREPVYQVVGKWLKAAGASAADTASGGPCRGSSPAFPSAACRGRWHRGRRLSRPASARACPPSSTRRSRGK